MDEDEVEDDVRRDTVWHRPSWPFGSILPGGMAGKDGVKDDFGIFGAGFGFNANGGGEPEGTPATPVEARALGILDLRPPLTTGMVKARYKELVKRHHPDANGGDKICEERFKEINRAYQIIMEILDAG